MLGAASLAFSSVPHGCDVLQQTLQSDAKCALSLQVTISGAPATTIQHPSSPLKFESPPAELDADAAANTSSSPSPSSVTTVHPAFLSELPTPRTIVTALTAIRTPFESPKATPGVEALTTMGISPKSPKAVPLVNGSPRPALANLTNRLTPQVTLFSTCCVLAEHCTALCVFKSACWCYVNANTSC